MPSSMRTHKRIVCTEHTAASTGYYKKSKVNLANDGIKRERERGIVSFVFSYVNSTFIKLNLKNVLYCTCTTSISGDINKPIFTNSIGFVFNFQIKLLSPLQRRWNRSKQTIADDIVRISLSAVKREQQSRSRKIYIQTV